MGTERTGQFANANGDASQLNTYINCKCNRIFTMVESKVLSERRKYLLELIGAAADEIMQIDELLAPLQSSVKKDCFF